MQSIVLQLRRVKHSVELFLKLLRKALWKSIERITWGHILRILNVTLSQLYKRLYIVKLTRFHEQPTECNGCKLQLVACSCHLLQVIYKHKLFDFQIFYKLYDLQWATCGDLFARFKLCVSIQKSLKNHFEQAALTETLATCSEWCLSFEEAEKRSQLQMSQLRESTESVN